ncbi:hypothetical protein [Falsihalocynthiibacter arcticus]|uniref:HPt domain-containing protein n=1 Tax=Falsihalocynthiibacter arcticus TaxID=1579316 RepID=A0A126UWK6_9RHOB|nr:hypothetical protein [Falsihalocynthiibacter arcticus]AML50461.1 hypothetical protein RC74_03525 [Falsihalocynthiibacter arcticus]
MTDGAPSSKYETRVTEMRKRFICSLDGRLDAIIQVIDAESESTGGENHPRKLHRLLHDMSGSFAMLELTEISWEIRTAVVIAENADKLNRALTPDEKTETMAVIAQTRAIGTRLKEEC